MRAGYDLITRRYKRKMEQGSIAQKRGSIVLPWLYIYVYTYVQLSGRQRCTVDRNRATIKSYLSYCYLGRNSPQVGIQGRTRENGTVSKARSKPRRQEPTFYLSLSLSLPCLYVHSVARSVHTVTGYILMVLDLCACTLSFLFLARNKRANNERNRTGLSLASFEKPCFKIIKFFAVLTFWISPPWFPGFAERKRIGRHGRSRYAAVTNYVNENGREVRYHAPFCILLCMTA